MNSQIRLFKHLPITIYFTRGK